MGSQQVPWKLEAGNEWVAHDPFGRVKSSDVSETLCPVEANGQLRLSAARNGYVSFRLWVTGSGSYRLAIDADKPIEVDLFRAWYHKLAESAAQRTGASGWFVDALVPEQPDAVKTLPDPDNAIGHQTQQEYWVDLFVPADAPPGRTPGKVVLEADGKRIELPLVVEVLEAVIPDDDAIICDHNSYGCRWLTDMYPGAFARRDGKQARWAKMIELLHHYYRICHEHRGHFSNLGAGHAGTFDPIYGPQIRGAGRDKSLEGWEWFDRHYGPLLDGSAFAGIFPGAVRARRPARCVWGVYTPISVDWPADYLWWGQPGYEVEFTRCVGQFDEHFRQNNWLTTHPLFFFNHKKRYRWYEWDGDEPKYPTDDKYFIEMGRLFKAAVGDTPVPWLYRMDASWQMQRHFELLAGMVNFWVCAAFSRWYPDELAAVAARGDVVWTYSGTPGVADTSSALLEYVWRTWGRGIHGHCEWLTVAPGPDPWFDCNGAETGMIYPGERFGVAGPIPSVRLKLQRNAVQDINLIDARARAGGRLDEVRADLTRRVPVSLFEPPPKVVEQQPPERWDSRDLADSPDANMTAHAALDPLWWAPIRQTALGKEGK